MSYELSHIPRPVLQRCTLIPQHRPQPPSSSPCPQHKVTARLEETSLSPSAAAQKYFSHPQTPHRRQANGRHALSIFKSSRPSHATSCSLITRPTEPNLLYPATPTLLSTFHDRSPYLLHRRRRISSRLIERRSICWALVRAFGPLSS